MLNIEYISCTKKSKSRGSLASEIPYQTGTGDLRIHNRVTLIATQPYIMMKLLLTSIAAAATPTELRRVERFVTAADTLSLRLASAGAAVILAVAP